MSDHFNPPVQSGPNASQDGAIPPIPSATSPRLADDSQAYNIESEGELPTLERFYSTESVLSVTEQGIASIADHQDVVLTSGDHALISDLLHTSDEGHNVRHYHGWLGKDVLLQGTFHLTEQYLLFFGHVPMATLQPLRASPLEKKSSTLLPNLGRASYQRYWFVLRMGALCWYADAGDVYHPIGVLPLRNMESVMRRSDVPEKFVLKSQNGKSYTFRADSRNAAHEWVKALRKDMFRVKTKGPSGAGIVRIPLKNIIGVDTRRLIDIATLLSIQVVAASEDTHHPHQPLVGNYSFVFFGETTPGEEIAKRLSESTNNFANQRGVVASFNDGTQLHVDFTKSQFGPIDEDMLDSTPPAAFHLHEGNEYGSDRDVLISPGLLNSPVGELPGSEPSSASASTSVSRAPSQSTTRQSSRNLSPVSSSLHLHGGHHKHKLNVFSSLSQKLHKLKHETSEHASASIGFISHGSTSHYGDSHHGDSHYGDSHRGDTLSGGSSNNDLASLMNISSVPLKLLHDSEHNDSSDDEDADSDDENSSMSNEVAANRLLPFTPQNYCLKLCFANFTRHESGIFSSGSAHRTTHQDPINATSSKSGHVSPKLGPVSPSSTLASKQASKQANRQASQQASRQASPVGSRPPSRISSRPVSWLVRRPSKGKIPILGSSASSIHCEHSGQSLSSSQVSSGNSTQFEMTLVDNEEEVRAANDWFQNCFGLEPFVMLVSEYLCDLERPHESKLWSTASDAAWNGRLLLSDQFLCFLCHNKNERLMIPMREIIHIKRSDPNSTLLQFEVSEASYGVFGLHFSEPMACQDAEATLTNLISQVAENDPDVRANVLFKENQSNEDASMTFLKYDLHSARMSSYEPEVTLKLRTNIPPMVFDSRNPNYGEEFLRQSTRSRKFVMLMIGSRGDVQPYIALSQGLMKESHKCVIVSHSEFKDWVEGFGIEFREIAGDPRELMEIMISHGSISYSFIKDALHHFKQFIKDLMRTAWDQIKSCGAEVLIESPSSMIGIHIAEALNIPYFRAFTMPWTRTKMYPQALVVSDQNKSGTYNSLTYLMYDRMVWFGISKLVNRWRKKHLDLPATDLDTMHQDEVPFLYCVSPTVLVPPIDQSDWVHTCGYWELEKEKKQDKDIDEKLIDFIKKAKSENIPVVYIGFGSIIVEDPEAMTNSVVNATRDAKVYCVLARGWSARSTKEDKKDKGSKDGGNKKKDKTPIKAEHVFEVDSVDHQWLFSHMSVCVHHGGCGTTGASLRAGIPTIIKPFFGDQFFYGHRVEELGVGVDLKKLTRSGLAEALKECITNREMVRQAKELGKRISHEHGVYEAILTIYREITYAKDVTERRRKRTLEAAKGGFIHSLHDSWIPGHHSKHRLNDAIDPENIEKEGEIESKVDLHESHSRLSLPKLGRRDEEARRNRNCDNDDIDVSL